MARSTLAAAKALRSRPSSLLLTLGANRGTSLSPSRSSSFASFLMRRFTWVNRVNLCLFLWIRNFLFLSVMFVAEAKTPAAKSVVGLGTGTTYGKYCRFWSTISRAWV